MGRYGLGVTDTVRKTQFGPRDQNDRASTYVEVLLNNHALPCNIKVAQAKVSNLSRRDHGVRMDPAGNSGGR